MCIFIAQTFTMKNYTLIAILFCCAFAKAYSQQLSGPELVAKSIAYHDPNSNWATFSGEFTLVLEMPDKPDRKSVITLDLPREYFNVTTTQDGKTSFRELLGTACKYTNEAGEVITSTTADEDCERTVMFRNYYSYLYGLPMKLTDKGTIIEEEVKKQTFKGKEYLVARVRYDKNVGTDVWQFYFDPETFAMEVYQFFKGDDETTGEYILLTNLATIGGIKMPKDRAWYYNKNDGYLGTDKIKIN